MAKILITGGEGKLGSAIKEASKEFSDLNLVFTDIDDFDITNAASVDEYLKTGDFDYLINCAAYTAVDKAEEEKGLAFLINATGPENLAKTCQKYNCRLVHISTDYVFDGRSHIPYIETMETNPPSVYGQSKLEGEKAILKHSKSAIILRTSWLYYEFGNNFLNTMIKLGAERDALGVVFDQIGTPTYARDFATSILKIITSNKISAKTEIYNYSNEGVISWYDFAKEIMEIANINCNIIPIESKEYPLPAPRPHYSVLNKSKIKSAFDLRIPYWKDSLNMCLKKLSEKSLTK
jgi:dTDP-4-dehydrorhamnose reductase